jgi:hypothetical protein
MRSDPLFVQLHSEYRAAWSLYARESEAVQCLQDDGLDHRIAVMSARLAEEQYLCARNKLASYMLENALPFELPAAC